MEILATDIITTELTDNGRLSMWELKRYGVNGLIERVTVNNLDAAVYRTTVTDNKILITRIEPQTFESRLRDSYGGAYLTETRKAHLDMAKAIDELRGA